jgi:hypothetical protein
MRAVKRAMAKVFGALAFVAAAVAFFVPLNTLNQWMIFMGSIWVILLCVMVSTTIDDEPGNISLFPPKSDK